MDHFCKLLFLFFHYPPSLPKSIFFQYYFCNICISWLPNTPLATKKSGWIDFNAGVVADGTATLEEAAEDLMRLVLETASGKQTKTEQKGFREISIFKDGVML